MKKKHVRFESWGTSVSIRGAMSIREAVCNLETYSSLKIKLTTNNIFPEISVLQIWDWRTFSIKSQIVTILGLWALQFLLQQLNSAVVAESSPIQYVNKWVCDCFSIKLYL